MCGIVCGVAERNIVPILLEGLKRLEYRGYDSAGISVVDEKIKTYKHKETNYRYQQNNSLLKKT